MITPRRMTGYEMVMRAEEIRGKINKKEALNDADRFFIHRMIESFQKIVNTMELDMPIFEEKPKER